MNRATIHIYDSVTTLGDQVKGAVVIGASHGGVYAAHLAAQAGVQGVILNDAGVGLHEAGIAGLRLLDACAIPGATVSHITARIGDGQDSAKNGRISAANTAALACGVVVGMPAMDAARRMSIARPASLPPAPLPAESRKTWNLNEAGRAIVLIDSVSLATPCDRDAIIVTGSHGGLHGGDPETAVPYPVFAALFNDAGIGKDQAGVSRLPVLDEKGIVAATVAAAGARIGDAQSTYEDGVLSWFNERARQAGARKGMAARDFVELLSLRG